MGAELVIRGGTVVDGTGAAMRRADVAVDEGRIVAVGDDLQGDRVIDATVKRGTLSVISGKIAKATPQAVKFSAPGMTLGVRGTSFIIDAGQ